MIKRTIKETTNEYDTAGKLIRVTVIETTEEDDTLYVSSYTPYISNNDNYFKDAMNAAHGTTIN